MRGTERMKNFIIKVVNFVLVSGILCCYQHFAVNRQEQFEVYEETLAQAKRQEVARSSLYQSGTFEGMGTGFGGDISVRIVIKKGIIQSAQVTKAEKETPDYLKSAKKILGDVVAQQSADVDTVSGATLSSNGILAAVREALGKSSGVEGKEGRQ